MSLGELATTFSDGLTTSQVKAGEGGGEDFGFNFHDEITNGIGLLR